MAGVNIEYKITVYRVYLETVATFGSRISRLPRGLEIPSWTFFNSPFCVDFKYINFSIVCNKIFQKYDGEVILKVNMFLFIVESRTEH